MQLYNYRSVRIVKWPDTIPCKDTLEGARDADIKIRNVKKENFWIDLWI